jgi:hypothetical protein
MANPTFFIASETTSFLTADAVSKRFATISKDAGISGLSQKLMGAGFKPMTKGKNAYFGVTRKWKGSDGQTATFEMQLQSYSKAGSKDTAAVAMVTIRSGNNSDTYRFSLIAPNGDFEKQVEAFADANNKVKTAKSWYTRWRDCVKRRCAAVCLGSLTTCSGTWAAYLACVAAACGGCALTCTGCATCRCRFWCKWAVGCCG